MPRLGDQCGQKLEGGENKAVFPDLGVVERRGWGDRPDNEV